MIKVYVVHFSQGLQGYDWEKEVNEIQSINPDKIICMCMEEQNWSYLFNVFLNKIMPWIIQNNKILDVVAPDVGNVKMNNVKVNSSMGMLFWQAVTIREWIDDLARDNLEQLYPVSRYPGIQAEKLYTCYNNNPKYQRAILVDMLARDRLLKDGIVSFTQPDKLSPPGHYAWQYHDGTRLTDEPDFILHSKPEYNPAVIPKSYLKGFLDVVTESEYGPNEFFLTEKTIKSLVFYKPFIVLGSPGFNTEFLAKKLGFQLYDELFDYSFDSCERVEDRAEGIVGNLKKLKHILGDDAGKKDMIKRITRKLYYNRAKLFDIYFDPDKTIPDCFKFIRETSDYQFYGHTNSAWFSHMNAMNWIKL